MNFLIKHQLTSLTVATRYQTHFIAFQAIRATHVFSFMMENLEEGFFDANYVANIQI
jgi:hypothetical protein